MNSGSSELLLDRQQQQAELERKRKLLELASAKVKVVEKRERTLREKTKFYCTSTLAFFSVTAGASLLFLVPLYVDPAISTLVGDFIETPTTCITTRREDLIGLFNCTWSSCREGCTSDFFRCTHIYVTYVEANFSYPYNVSALDLANLTDLERYVRNEESMLMVNIKGCGYPPSIKCKNFTENFGYEGATFPCHYSRQNKSVVMPHYKRGEQIAVIRNYFVIPFIVTVLSSIGLCVIHCDCKCKKERSRRRHQRYRRPKVENLSDSSISTRVDMLTPGTEAYKPPQL